MATHNIGIIVEAEDKASSVLDSIGGAIAGLGKVGLAVAAGGVAALGAALVGGVMDARDAAKVMAVTEQTIKTMGGASGVSAQHVADFAASLSAAAGKSLFGDTQIQEASNLLLTFGNIKGETLDLATVLTTDLATALGGAPRDQAMMLGKALNDPVKGITALGKAGLTFSEEQKAAIAAMVETGDIAGAQALIIAELNKQVGGQAAAAAAADGGWAQLKDRLGEAAETVGALLLPALNAGVGFLNDSVMPAIELVAGSVGGLVDAFNEAGGGTLGLGAAINTLLSTVFGLNTNLGFLVTDVLDKVIAAFTDAKNPVDGFLGVLARVSPAFALIKAGIDAALPPIQAIITTVFGIISAFLAEHGAKIQADVGGAWQQIQAIINAVIPPIQAIINTVFSAIAAFLSEHGAEIQETMAIVWDTIALVVQTALSVIQATIVPALQAIGSFISSHGNEIKAIINIAWQTIRTIILTVTGVIRGIIAAATAAIKGDWSGAWEAIKGVAQTVWNGIKSLLSLNLQLITILFKSTWEGIKAFFQGILDGMVGWVLQTMQGIVNAIKGFAGAARSAAGGVADAIIDGISSGISNGASAIANAARNAAMSALDAAKRALGIASPSKLFRAEVGRNIGLSTALGIDDMIPRVESSAASMAGAAVAGAQSVTNNYNLNYQGAPAQVGDVRSALRAQALLTGAMAT